MHCSATIADVAHTRWQKPNISHERLSPSACAGYHRAVRRFLVCVALMMAACGDDSARHTPDAPPIDSPAGSASMAAWSPMDPSPRDHNLELGVLVVSVFVAAGPVAARRRRKSS
jgi:hypothetical protein